MVEKIITNLIDKELDDAITLYFVLAMWKLLDEKPELSDDHEFFINYGHIGL